MIRKLFSLIALLAFGYSVAHAGEIRRVCTTSSQASQNMGKCRVSPYNDGDMCFLTMGLELLAMEP
ncbi:MAG: hypothetical protein HLUCCX10_07955 [Algoriphagus marincola HL-49]|uniref:Uncharacterized protein n=1 Tax=Algoriphagus marincola HL-49 TaxID=1305737 RepID=A0A0P8C155_9BACT|nr:MAG: hypothetical protein HLUCCX10_07955 [Algoriphagus marincola HL-49]